LTPERLARVLGAIDAANARDPRQTEDGRPRELVYADRLTAWVLRLTSTPSDALRIAARGQHIERWTSPRESQPLDRGGYLRWREQLKRFHADRVGGLMREQGCTEDEIRRVADLITKVAHRAGDPEGMILEDALCLLFFETPWDALRAKLPADKLENALRKTWKKMGTAGRDRARGLALHPELRRRVDNLAREGIDGRA
jgi:hypothetical protein